MQKLNKGEAPPSSVMRGFDSVFTHPSHSSAAFVLHSWPWKETSLIVEFLSASHGRIAAVAKGARRPHSPIRGLLQPFLPLAIKLSGKSEIKTLGKVQVLPPFLELPEQYLAAGLYANELTLALVPPASADDAIFSAYTNCIQELSHNPPAEGALRRLEKRLLIASGFSPSFDQASEGKIQPEETYTLVEGKGWVITEKSLSKSHPLYSLSEDKAEVLSVKGSILLAIANEQFAPNSLLPRTERSAIKQVLHYLLRSIAPQVGKKSRQSWQELSALAKHFSNRTPHQALNPLIREITP